MDESISMTDKELQLQTVSELKNAVCCLVQPWILNVSAPADNWY